MLDPKLLRTVWACANELKISREEVHDAIFAGWKKGSVKELTDAEARQLLDGMRGKKYRPATGRGRSIEHRQAMGEHGRKDDGDRETEYVLSAEEKRLLWQTAFNLGMNADGFERFCTRQCGVAEPRTLREFNKVMWGLKAMQRRRGHVA